MPVRHSEDPIRVMIIEDSDVVRALLVHILEEDPRFQIVAAVASAEEGLRLLPRVRPDVISLDIRLPGMNGFEATHRIMAEQPTPIVVVSASVEAADLKVSMNALRAGALTVVEKPVAVNHHAYRTLAGHLRTQLAIMSQVRVIRQHPQYRGTRIAGAPQNPPVAAQLSRGALKPFRMLGIVASTGGPAAVIEVLRELGGNFPLPVVLLQHITPAFLDGFVAWLNEVCPAFTFTFARDGDRPAPGAVYLPPADRHLEVRGDRLRLIGGALVCGQRPSGTVLFRSMAAELGAAALAVLLTGMGEDGAAGLLDIRQAGGYTITEHESTAIVYGMPAAAARLGAASEQLPLPAIGPRLVQLLARERKA